ncbi:MAG: ABC transporter permease subunit [Gammaproteobacteria bacterium]|nr:ABC transporter permease subunit [Gammaproteobacteria bacterium]
MNGLTRYTQPISRILPVLCLLPLTVLLLLFVFAPLYWILQSSLIFEDGLRFSRFSEIVNAPFYQKAFSNSLYLSFWSAVIGLVISATGAASLRRVDGKLRNAVVAFTNMTSNMAGVPLAFAFIVVMGTNGAVTLILRQSFGIEGFNLYSMNGLLLVYIYFQIPLGVLMLYPAYDALRDDWQEAAALLGAGKWRYWLHIGIPVLLPALGGTFILLLANALGAYASAYALTSGNFNLLTIRIASLVAGDLFPEPETAAALSVLLMLLLCLVSAVNHWLLRRSYHAAG